jgi:anti-anti-sigma factor
MTDSEHRVQIDRRGDVTVLRVQMKHLVDYDVADTLARELIAAVGDRPGPKVVVDMSGLDFLSSVGYGPFITLRAHVRKHEGRLVLANMSAMIREVFDATRLLINPSSPKSLFEYRDSVEAAVAELSG